MSFRDKFGKGDDCLALLGLLLQETPFASDS